MTREEMERRALIRARRQRARKLRRNIFIALIIMIIIPVIYSFYSHGRVKKLSKSVNTLERRLKQSDESLSKLQKDFNTQKKENDALKEKQKTMLNKYASQVDNKDKPNVYLTFDDGPSDNTDKILDILEKNNVHATFFVIAHDDPKAAERYKRIVADGDTLALHSYSHNYSQLYANMNAFKNDVTQIRDYVYKITGVKCKFYRFPGGSSNTVHKMPIAECIKWLTSQNITYFDWNAENGDAMGVDYTPAQLVNNAIKQVKEDSTNPVILMHDAVTKGNTVKALPSLIKRLKAMNYDILAIDDTTELVQHVKADSVK